MELALIDLQGGGFQNSHGLDLIFVAPVHVLGVPIVGTDPGLVAAVVQCAKAVDASSKQGQLQGVFAGRQAVFEYSVRRERRNAQILAVDERREAKIAQERADRAERQAKKEAAAAASLAAMTQE